jgi:hypothetical protein
MWYRNIITAQQGVMNLDRIFQGAEKAITSWLQNMTTLLPSQPGELDGGYFEFENVEVPPFLKKYISNIDHNVQKGALGSYNPFTKVVSLPKRVPRNQYNNLLSTVLHEIRHSIDPRYNNSSLMENYKQQYNLPNFINNQIMEIFKSTTKIPSYEEIISKIILGNGGDLNDPYIVEMTKKNWPESIYNTALSSISKQKNLYYNNPIEHSSQLGDIKALLSKENLDKVREFIKNNQKENQSDLQIRLLLKNGLNPKSHNFEAFSNIIQQVSGNQGSSLSQVVKSTQDPKWQEQYLKQVSNAVSVYNTDGNRFKGLVRKENLVQPGVKSNPKFNLDDNAKAIKSREAFFGKVAQIEALAEQNPKAWNKFINSNFAMKMINNKIYNLFKGIGSGSKSLSQSVKGLNMQSPYWALLEPALEFGLYQFGLFLENPKAYNLETPEQKTIRDLNSRINEILANNKITDKRGYFIKNYGSYLKTLGTMEQNGLLGKFPVMGFNQFQNIGRNIGQK